MKYNAIAAQTIENIQTHLAQTGGIGCEKFAGSSDGIVWERPGYHVDVRLTQLTQRGSHEFLLFQAYPGICADEHYYSLIASYIEEYIHPAFGSVQVDKEHGDVFFKCELPIFENAVSVQTMGMLEAAAKETLSRYGAALNDLAHGFLPEEAVPELPEAEVFTPMDTELLERCSASMTAYFRNDSGNNMLAKGESDNGMPFWVTEIYAGKGHYMMRTTVSPSGMATVAMTYGGKGIIIPKPYRRMTAVECQKSSSRRKVGYLDIGDQENGLSVKTNICLLDGPVTVRTMEDVEAILVKLMMNEEHRLRMISYGLLPEEEKEEEPRMPKFGGAPRGGHSTPKSGTSDFPDLSDLLKRLGGEDHGPSVPEPFSVPEAVPEGGSGDGLPF